MLASGVGALLFLLLGAHLLALHEGPGWISPLVLGDHLFDVALALITLLYALALGRMLATPLLGLEPDSLVEALAALGLGLGMLSQAILILGFLRLYYGATFLVAFVVLTWWLRHELRRVIDCACSTCRCWLHAGMPSAPTLGQRLVLFILLLTMLSVFIRALVPVGGADADWDALAYHQAAPKIYIALHRYVPLPDIQLSNAPSGEQMLLIPGLLAGTDGQEKVLNLAFALLIGISVYAIGRRHFGRPAGWLGALLFFNTIWVVPIIPVALVDFSSAFLLVLGFGDALAWADRAVANTRQVGTTRNARRVLCRPEDRLLVRAGLLMGLAASFKLVTLPALPAACCAILFSALFLSRDPTRIRLARAISCALTFSGAALAGLIIWLLKSEYFFGAAFYPINVQPANNGGTSADTLHVPPSLPVDDHLAILKHLWLLITSTADLAWQFTSPFCLLLLVGPFLLRRPSGRAAIVFLLVGGVLWMSFDVLFLPPRYWLGMAAMCDAVVAGVSIALIERLATYPLRLRVVCLLILYGVTAYWLTIVPFNRPSTQWLLIVIAAQGLITGIIGSIASRQRTRAWLMELPMVSFLIINSVFGLFLELRQLDRVQAVAVVSGQVSRAAYLSAHVQPYAAEAYVEDHIPAMERVVLLGVTRSGYLERSYLADWYGTRRNLIIDPRSRTEELTHWCRLHVHYAMFNQGPEQLDGVGIQPLSTFAWLRTPGLHPRILFSARGVDVLSMTPCTAAADATSR